MYIEFVIADNFLLTYLAGATAIRVCGKRVNVWRLAAAATVGTVVAVFYPYMRLGVGAQFAVKLALGAVLSFMLFFKTQKPITSSLLFFGCTFAYGGACYALGLILYSSASDAAIFSKRCPLFVVLTVGVMLYYCARFAVKRLNALRARAPYEYGAKVEVYGCTLHFNAFLDTGNCVFDDVTGLPVIITDTGRFGSKLTDDALRVFLKSLDGMRRVTIKTPAGEATAYMIRPTSVTVYSDRQEHKIDAMVGLVGGNRFRGPHEMLLNPAVIAEGV